MTIYGHVDIQVLTTVMESIRTEINYKIFIKLLQPQCENKHVNCCHKQINNPSIPPSPFSCNKHLMYGSQAI